MYNSNVTQLHPKDKNQKEVNFFDTNFENKKENETTVSTDNEVKQNFFKNIISLYKMIKYLNIVNYLNKKYIKLNIKIIFINLLIKKIILHKIKF